METSWKQAAGYMTWVPVAEARIEEIRSRYESLGPVMDERVTRLWAAGEARALGRGGIAAVTKATHCCGSASKSVNARPSPSSMCGVSALRFATFDSSMWNTRSRDVVDTVPV